MIETNALLDTGSDSTFISNVMSVSKSINSKLVSFSISSNNHPENVKIENAWVVKDLNLPNSKVSVHEVKDKWPHLRHVDIPEPSNEDVTILIGSDFPHLLFHLDHKSGKPNDPIAVKTKLGWVLMGGRSNSINSSSNLIHTDSSTLSEKVEQFWAIESYGTNKSDETKKTTFYQKTRNERLTY